MARDRVQYDEANEVSDSGEEAVIPADRRIVWGFGITLLVFKLATVVVIAWAAGWDSETGLLLSATTWPWFLVAGIAVASPLMWRIRLRRVRAKREALLRAEWMLETEG